MTPSNQSIDSLRSRIDRIDDQIHDLLMERCTLVEQIGALKAGETDALRPGREAEILRRLTGRHLGTFPKAALVRIWREIVGALVGLQKPMTMAVAQPERGAGFIELARNHFGVVWPVKTTPSAGQVIRMVAEDQAAVGVVPLPGHGPAEAEAWWATLTADRPDIPRVIARLPVYPPDPASRVEPLEALVVAKRPHDRTDHDRTLIALETAADTSRDRARAMMTAAGFDTVDILASRPMDDDGLIHLVLVEGWVGSGDGRFGTLLRDPVRHASVIGGYAVPLAP
jgi:chorismate mutase-like protein